MRFGKRFFFASLYRKIKDQNPSTSEDFSKTFLKWPRDGLETTWRQCWSSGRKKLAEKRSALCKLLCVPYRRLKAGFSVCWLRSTAFVCVVLWEFWLRLNEIHEVRTFAPCKGFLFVLVVVIVAVFLSLENYFGFRRTKLEWKRIIPSVWGGIWRFGKFPKRFVLIW